MKQPQSFREFAAHCLYAEEIAEDMSYQDAIVEEAFLRLPTEQRAEVRAYLDHLLAGGYSDQKLWDIWNSSGAGIIFFPSPREFFRQVLAMTLKAMD